MDIMKMGAAPGYLGSWDIEELPSREVTLTIEKIVDEEVVASGRSEVCTVIHWTDKTYKPMIMNVTNKKTLSKLYKTKDTEKLAGNAVVIGIERVKAFGDVFDALRIRPRKPAAPSVKKVKCEECGNEITPRAGMTAEQVAAYTKDKYGKKLCGDCATAKAQEAGK